ncbi:MAG: CopD family protein [Deltaproteobacteria bacterium]|nr:CopD family protein [Deltaproteobacteria bacterium]
MSALYFASVWIHVLSAIAWIGGMLFLVLVVVPWMRTQDRATGARFLAETGRRFSKVGWVAFALLFATGCFNLSYRGVTLDSFTDPRWLGSSFGRTVIAKLAIFALVLVMSAVHDFAHGPRALEEIRRDPGSARAEVMRRRASLLGRLNALLALVLFTLGVAIVRGWP